MRSLDTLADRETNVMPRCESDILGANGSLEWSASSTAFRNYPYQANDYSYFAAFTSRPKTTQALTSMLFNIL